jgi:hypothetical protein
MASHISMVSSKDNGSVGSEMQWYSERGGGGSQIRDKSVGDGRVEGGIMGEVVSSGLGTSNGVMGEQTGSPGGLGG